jgi:hypothetical protein
MVISKKPRLFIYAALVALLPLFGLANPNDSTTVSHQVAHADKTTHENTEGLTKEQLKVKETKCSC